MVTKVLSVGGSIIAPDQPDTTFLTKFLRMTVSWLNVSQDRRLILVAGGGAPARVYQAAYRKVCAGKGLLIAGLSKSTTQSENTEADWIGVMATRLNAELLRACYGAIAFEKVITNPLEAPADWRENVMVAAGWKPGFSSDNDAVLLAEKYGADTVVNLSNIAQVYTDDPKKNPDAEPLDRISWADFRKMVGDDWQPGLNVPFDPVASQKAEALGLTVICADGHDVDNTRAILNGNPFIGTTIA